MLNCIGSLPKIQGTLTKLEISSESGRDANSKADRYGNPLESRLLADRASDACCNDRTDDYDGVKRIMDSPIVL
jgi:hypothetical protein